MRVSTVLRSCTSDAEAAGQAVESVAAALSRVAAQDPDFEGFGELSMNLTISNPVRGAAPRRASGSFHAPTNTFFVTAPLDYAAWVDTPWGARVAAVADALGRPPAASPRPASRRRNATA